MAEDALPSLTQAQLRPVTAEIRFMAGQLGVNWCVWDRPQAVLKKLGMDGAGLAAWMAECVAVERATFCGVERYGVMAGNPGDLLRGAVVSIHKEAMTLEVISCRAMGE